MVMSFAFGISSIFGVSPPPASANTTRSIENINVHIIPPTHRPSGKHPKREPPRLHIRLPIQFHLPQPPDILQRQHRSLLPDLVLALFPCNPAQLDAQPRLRHDKLRQRPRQDPRVVRIDQTQCVDESEIRLRHFFVDGGATSAALLLLLKGLQTRPQACRGAFEIASAKAICVEDFVRRDRRRRGGGGEGEGGYGEGGGRFCGKVCEVGVYFWRD